MTNEEAAAERYPECARPVNVSPMSRIIGEFIDSSEYILCKWDDDFGEFIPLLDASKTILAATLPAIEKEIRAQVVAAVIEAALPAIEEVLRKHIAAEVRDEVAAFAAEIAEGFRS